MTPLFLGLALAVAAPAPKKADEPPPAKLDGEWLVESMEGPKEPKAGNVTMRFTDGKFSIMEAGRAAPENGTYTTDTTKKPAIIDIRLGNGGKDMVVEALLELKGDTLRLCFRHGGGARPTEFKGDAEAGVMLITLKRVKADK